MSRRIALVNPPSAPGTTANREGAGGLGNVYPSAGAFLYPPHALAVAAGVLRRQGWEVVARDFVVEGAAADAALSWARQQAVDALAVLVSWATWDTDRRFLEGLRDAVAPRRVIAIGPSLGLIEGCVEGVAAIPGEPEWALDLECGDLPLRGLAERRQQAVALHKERDLECDSLLSPPSWPSLAGLPMPAWDLFPVDRYGFLTLYSGKGCNRTCAYCPYVVAQGPYRARPADETVEEFRWLVRTHRPRKVVFRDPVFAHDRKVALQVCRGLADVRPRTSWECESRPECLDPELLREMQRAGCVTVKLGVESVDARVLARSGRILTEDAAVEYRTRIEDIVEACRRLGIGCRAFTMVGLPGEDDASVEATAAFLRQVRPDAVHAKPVERYPMNRLDPDVADPAALDSRRRRLEGALGGAPRGAARGRLGSLARRLFR